jgi:predicted hydrocarbon binding protein
MYPDYYRAHDDTYGFLLGVEGQIHEIVRQTFADSAPPRLDVKRMQSGVAVTYTSPRQLCELLDGLVVGVSRFYGDALSIDEPLCMLRGDPACTFFVQPA